MTWWRTGTPSAGTIHDPARRRPRRHAADQLRHASAGRAPPIALLSEVRFANDADTLLATECLPVPEGEEERCRILRVDLKTKTTTAYEAGPDQSIGYPTPEADGKSIMAVRFGRKRDDQGNRPTELVTFGIDDPRVTVVYRHPTEMLNPRRAGNGIIFWSRRCYSLTDRYCRKEPTFRGHDGNVGLVERSYNFAEVGPIFRWHGKTYANAGYSEEMVSDNNSAEYQLDPGFSGFWELSASSRYGVKQTTRQVHAMMGQANETSDLVVFASGEKSLGLYRVRGDAVERLSPVPETVVPEGASEERSIDISPDNRRVVFLVGLPPLENPLRRNDVTMFDIAGRTWQRIAIPPERNVRTLRP